MTAITTQSVSARPSGTHQSRHDFDERLYLHRHTSIHGLPAAVKISSLTVFVFAVVCTPVRQVWAFGIFLAILSCLATLAQLPPARILPRLMVEVPFLIFALLMPLTGPAPLVTVAGLELSEPGLWAAWGIVAKGTLGVLGAVILAATTPARDLIDGLRVLRLPEQLVQIAAFMLRYTHVIGDEMRRMRVARESRGFDATGPRAWRALAHSAGGLFIRSYERGERVHLAMLSRGFTGEVVRHHETPNSRQWLAGLAFAGLGLTVCVVALFGNS